MTVSNYGKWVSGTKINIILVNAINCFRSDRNSNVKDNIDHLPDFDVIQIPSSN